MNNNIINNFNNHSIDFNNKYKLTDDDSILSCFDIITDKIRDIHCQMFNYSVSKYAESIGTTIEKLFQDNIIVDLRDFAYYKPSKLQIKSKTFPYQYQIVDLTPYWPRYNYKSYQENKIINKNSDNSFGTETISYVDFARNFCIMNDNSNDIDTEVKLSNITK